MLVPVHQQGSSGAGGMSNSGQYVRVSPKQPQIKQALPKGTLHTPIRQPKYRKLYCTDGREKRTEITMTKISIEQVAQAGVVGAGGAGFPTHVKLAGKADTVLVNAAECEPLLHKDKEVLRNFADAVVEGLAAG